MDVITIGEAKNKEQIEAVIDAVSSGETLYTSTHTISIVIDGFVSRMRSKGKYAKASWLEHLHAQPGSCRVPRGFPKFIRDFGDI